MNKYTEYSYVHTYFTPEDDPELSDPEVYEVFNEGVSTEFLKAYKESKWQLTRFDTGSYWLDQL